VGAVTFRRQVPAEQYGSETIEVTLDLPHDGVGQAEYAKLALAAARELVQAELALSPNSNVRRIAERWRQAEESAELELAIGRRQADRGEDPEDLEDLPY
jgi:hypothetical protein